MSVGTIIRQRRKSLDLTQDYVAKRVGISKPYLSNIETDKSAPPTDRIMRGLERTLGFKAGELTNLAHRARTPPDVLRAAEEVEAERDKLRLVVKELLTKAPQREAGGVDLDDLLRKISDPSNVRLVAPGRAIPIINKVSAGYPQHFTDLDYPVSVAEDYIRCPDVHDPQAFAARVVGDSMEPLYREGDIVVFTPNAAARSGDDCFVRFAEDGGSTFKRFYEDTEGMLRLQPLNSKYPAEMHAREKVTGLWPAAYRMQRLNAS